MLNGNMKNKKSCYLCGSMDFITRPGSVRDKSDLKILECKSCSLVCLSSFEQISDDFYENSGMHGGSCYSPDVKSWLNDTASDDIRRFHYLKSVLPNIRLLDFGCGAGGFLLRARELSSVAHGLEPEKGLIDHYAKHHLEVFRNLQEIEKYNNSSKYDLITMFHVLEHISDPKAILMKLLDILTDEGQIIVEVPNADDALLSLYENIPFSHFTYWSCHLFLFTMKTLRDLFEQTNIKINYIKQIQRYPLSNHLHWLAKGKPGGHCMWNFIDSDELHNAYERQLAAIGKCDTLIASVSKK